MSLPKRPLAALACAAGLAALAATVFACSSSDGDGATSTCEGAACADGATEATTADGAPGVPHDGGAIHDAAPDTADETIEAGTCPLQSIDASAGDGGALQRASRFGITGGLEPSQVVLDPASDDIVAVGTFGGTVDFGGDGGTATTHANSGEIFVARFDKSGAATKWVKAFGNDVVASADAVGIGSAGHVVVAGFLSTTPMGADLDFGCGPLTIGGDVYVVDFDAGGTCVWSKRFNVSSNENRPSSLAVDAKGNVFISGFAVQSDFGGGAKQGYYLTKLTSTGAHVWTKTFAGLGAGFGADGQSALAVDADGNVLFAGDFKGTTDFGAGAVTAASRTAFVVKYSPSGKHLWSKQFAATPTAAGSNVESTIVSIAVDGCGAAYATGNFGRTHDSFGDETGVASTISLGSGTLAAPTTTSFYGFLAKLDASGSGVWSKAFEGSNANANGTGRMTLGSLAVDGAGRPTITALLSSSDRPTVAPGDAESVDFGGGPLVMAGSTSFAVAGFDAVGTYRWAHAGIAPSTFEDARAAYRGVAVSKNDASVVLLGNFGRPPYGPGVYQNSLPDTTLDIAGTSLTASGAADMFLATFAP